MRLAFRLLKIIAVVFIVIAVALFCASYFLQDKVAGLVIKSFNEKISTKYDFGSLRLSFLRRFPNANLDLKDVLVHSSPGFDVSCFKDVNTDTLLAAKSVSLEFRITDILKSIYNIEKIVIKEGHLFLLTDTAGNINYKISVKSDQVSGKNFSLNLNRINIRGLNAAYYNLATNLKIRGYIDNGKVKSRITSGSIDFNADGALKLSYFSLFDFKITKSISTLFDVSLHDSGKGIFFDRSTVSFDGFVFGLSGSISPEKYLDLKLSAENIDISGIRNYLPEKYNLKLSEYNPGGTLTVISRITGPVSGTINPGIEIAAGLRNGIVSYHNSALSIRDLSLDCIFNNGIEHKPSSSVLTFKNLQGKLGSGQYSGSFILSDFDKPTVLIKIDGSIIPSELKDFFKIKEIASAEGNIDINLKFQGNVPKKQRFVISDLFGLNPVGTMHFKSFGIGLIKNNQSVSQVYGDIFLGDSLAARNLSFKYRNHSFTISGIFMNLPEWLMGDRVSLSGNAELICKELYPEILFPELTSKGTVSAEKGNAVSLPGDIVMDLNFRIDELTYKNFNASNIIGTASYKPRIINFKNLTLKALDGIISGNGFIVQNVDKSFNGRGSFILDGVNVNKTFTSFNNFGQGFIKAENLNGKLSGNLSLLMPMDSLMKPVVRSLSAEGKYTLTDGSLINFEPVRSLSSYIELSELENIRFEKLENDFFIRNNVLYIPQMDILSSAANFTVNGQHGFDNDYEYHVMILLSELMSKKLKKPKPNTTEFGAVKDDGLGHTSVVLKIENKGNDVKVTYDVKAAGNNLKTNVKAERQTLKTILNQEYGWFKSDTTTTKQTRTGGEPRFKISWGEEDTVKADVEKQPVKKESTIKNISRKK